MEHSTCEVTTNENTECGEPAIWIVGLEIDEIWGASYDTCDAHLANAARAIVNKFTDYPRMNGRLELQNIPQLCKWEDG